MKLSNRVALITGGGSGIGRASALLFSAEGARIAVADIDEKGGRQTVDAIQGKGGSAVFVRVDVSKATDVERMIKATVEQYGKLDILFNNAGIGAPFVPCEEVERAFGIEPWPSMRRAYFWAASMRFRC